AGSHGVEDYTAAIDTLPAGEVARITRSHCRPVHHHAAILQFQACYLGKEFGLALLSQGLDHHAHLQAELRPGDGNIAAAAATVFRATLSPKAFQRFNAPVAAGNHSNRQRLPDKGYGILFGQLILVIEGGHLLQAAPIDHVYLLSAQSSRCRHHVDGGVAGPDDRNFPGHLDLIQTFALGFLDEGKRVAAALKILSRDTQVIGLAQTDADEDSLIVALEVCDADILPNKQAVSDLDAQRTDHLD